MRWSQGVLWFSILFLRSRGKHEVQLVDQGATSVHGTMSKSPEKDTLSGGSFQSPDGNQRLSFTTVTSRLSVPPLRRPDLVVVSSFSVVQSVTKRIFISSYFFVLSFLVTLSLRLNQTGFYA